MRRFILLAAGMCSACATAAPQPPVVGSGSRYVCRHLTYEEFIGRVATSEVGAEMLHASGARTMRWLRPGMMITMEYSAERLNVRLASNNRIITATCG